MSAKRHRTADAGVSLVPNARVRARERSGLRCAGTTKDGRRCRRRPEPGFDRCHWHIDRKFLAERLAVAISPEERQEMERLELARQRQMAELLREHVR